MNLPKYFWYVAGIVVLLVFIAAFVFFVYFPQTPPPVVQPMPNIPPVLRDQLKK